MQDESPEATYMYLRLLLFTIAGLLSPSGVLYADYDFYMDFYKCKVLLGYLVLSEKNLKVVRGDRSFMGCKRRFNAIHCDFIFKAETDQQGVHGNSGNYRVIIDSPPVLHFLSDNGAEYIAINTSQHAATLTSRALGRQYAGSKVCSGLYTTQFEMQSRGHQ
jgi:hypothetical protein